MPYPKVAQFRTVEAFRRAPARAKRSTLPVDEADSLRRRRLAARRARSTSAASPSAIAGASTRWKAGTPPPTARPPTTRSAAGSTSASSGAKLIWGGEAVAVPPDGRANPNQLLLPPENERRPPRAPRHAARRPPRALRLRRRPARRPAAHPLRPLLPAQPPRASSNRASPTTIRCSTRKFDIAPHDDSVVLTDDELQRLIDDYVAAARLAQRRRLPVRRRQSLPRLPRPRVPLRLRPPRPATAATSTAAPASSARRSPRIRAACPGLMIGVRLAPSITRHSIPTRAKTAIGRSPPTSALLLAVPRLRLPIATIPLQFDLAEPIRLLQMLHREGVALVNLTAGSPYYSPHIQRPAYYPPSDGYQPPEDPLVGCVRQIHAVRELKAAAPDLPWSAPPTPTSRSTCRTSPRPSSAPAGPTSSASAAWS